MSVSSTITPVLLCGGSGTRLWPLSRKSYPKQFVPLLGEKTMFQESALRLSGEGYGKPVILTNSDFRFIVTEQLAEIGQDPSAILIEPEGRNTGPAVLAAALWLEQQDPTGLMLIAPSDHVVPNVEAFRKAVLTGVQAAEQGKLITFGITPTHPETGYGYLELTEYAKEKSHDILDLVRFVEKPNLDAAENMLATGKYLWNAGIFLFSVRTIIEAFKNYCPQLVEPVAKSVLKGASDLGFWRLEADAWNKADNVSIDYAIMERAKNLAVVPFSGGWSDLGGWDAVWRESVQDDAHVALSGNSVSIDCKKSLLRSEDSGLAVVGIGLENIMTIATPDAVLVADMSRAQDIKDAVTLLKAKKFLQADQCPIDYRPWGWFETLVLADRFQVKRIVVKAGAALSLQSHFHRSEHWIVVAGTAKVTIGEEERLVTENQSIYIPLGEKHRLENPGKVQMVLIEVQTGSYLGEDDIVRYEDIYARN